MVAKPCARCPDGVAKFGTHCLPCKHELEAEAQQRLAKQRFDARVEQSSWSKCGKCGVQYKTADGACRMCGFDPVAHRDAVIRRAYLAADSADRFLLKCRRELAARAMACGHVNGFRGAADDTLKKEGVEP